MYPKRGTDITWHCYVYSSLVIFLWLIQDQTLVLNNDGKRDWKACFGYFQFYFMKEVYLGDHSIAPQTTSANAASASPQPPNEKSRKRQRS